MALTMDESDPYGALANDDETFDLEAEPLEDAQDEEPEAEEGAEEVDETEADDEELEADEPAVSARHPLYDYIESQLAGQEDLIYQNMMAQGQLPQAGFPQPTAPPAFPPNPQGAFQPGQLPSFDDYLAANDDYRRAQADYDDAEANGYDVATPRMELRLIKSELKAEYREQVAALQQQQMMAQQQAQAAQNQWNAGVAALASDKTFKAHLNTPQKQAQLTAFARSKGITDPNAAAWAFLGPKIAQAQKNAARSTTTRSRNVAAVPAGNSAGAGVGTNEHPPDTLETSRERTAWYKKYNPDYLKSLARSLR